MITKTYTVTGMTCAHCVAAVTDELSALDGVDAVSVDLVAGGDSTVTVSSQSPLDAAAVAEAVDEAGYALS
jgi:copper chaperone